MVATVLRQQLAELEDKIETLHVQKDAVLCVLSAHAEVSLTVSHLKLRPQLVLVKR